MRGRAFSLIELCIAVAIGIALVGLAIQAMLSIRRTVARAQVVVALHDEAAVIQRETGALLQAVHPCGLWRLTASSPDGVWGVNPATGQCDDVVELTWLATVPERKGRSFAFAADWCHDVVWARLTWRGDGAAGNAAHEPQLLLARSSPSGTGYASSWGASQVWFRTAPQPRRDRRRDLDDNDLRFVPGMTPAQYRTIVTATGPHGDDADLAAEAMPLHGPGTRAVACAISWVDRRGHVVAWDSRSGRGIAARAGDGGADEPVPGGGPGLAAVDGAWLDGRPSTAPGDPAPVDAMRPVLLRLTVTLADIPQSPSLAPASRDAALRADAAAATFTCTFPLDPVLGPP